MVVPRRLVTIDLLLKSELIFPVTDACTSEDGCTKRFISWKGCPYQPPSEYFDDPKCFFDDDITEIYNDPCEDPPGGDTDDDPEQDPAELWDPQHKYKEVYNIKEPNKQARDIRFLIKNILEDVCPMPNTYDLIGAVIDICRPS